MEATLTLLDGTGWLREILMLAAGLLVAIIVVLLLILNRLANINEWNEALCSEIQEWRHSRRECSCYEEEDEEDDDSEAWKRGANA